MLRLPLPAWTVVFLAVFPAVLHATAYRMAMGRYPGDGAPTHSITGLGFQPDVVIVKGDLGTAAFTRSSSMASGMSKPLGAAGAVIVDRIASLDVDGFTVASDPSVNAVTNEYFWIAFKASSDLMAVGAYIGTGILDTQVPVGFQPAYVIVMSEGNQQALQRFASQSDGQCVSFAADGEIDNRIVSFNGTGFRVGTDASVNGFGALYHYIAWKGAAEILVEDAYNGDSSPNRSYALGFQPRTLLIAQRNSGSAAVFSTDAFDSGVSSYLSAPGATLTNAILRFVPNGFQLGTHASVNSTSEEYFYAAFNTAADIALHKSVDDQTPAEGDTLTYTLALHNLGPDAVSGIDVNDLLPLGVTYLAHAPSQGTYSSVTGLWVAGGLAVGDSASMQLQATVDPAPLGTITNTASILDLDGSGDPNPSNNASTAPVTFLSGDLEVLKTVDDPTPFANGIVQYTIELTNYGSFTTTGIAVFDALPAGVTYMVHGSSHGSYSSSTGVWAVGTLDAAATATLLITARVDAGTQSQRITNTAYVSDAFVIDALAQNDTSSAAINVRAVLPVGNSDLRLSMTVDDPNPSEGDTLTYNVTLTNNGPDLATSVQVRNVHMPALASVSHTSNRGSFDPAGGTWTVGSLANAATASLALTVRLTPGSGAKVLTNAVSVFGADQSDPVGSNNSAQIDIRTVEIETIPVGPLEVLPGTSDVPLLLLHLENHRAQPVTLDGMNIDVAAGLEQLQLWLDDGDLVLETGSDSLLAAGDPTAGIWSVAGLAHTIVAAAERTLMLSGRVSLVAARHGQTLDVSIATPADLVWASATTAVTHRGFPIANPGSVSAVDLALAQISFTPIAGDTIFPAAQGVPLLRLRVPDNGGTSDTLERIDMQQIGTAVSGLDLESLHLQVGAGIALPDSVDPLRVRAGAVGGADPGIAGSGPGDWVEVEVARFYHTGGERWSASGFQLVIPLGGLEVRIVADVSGRARDGRTLRAALPISGLQLTSGRRGPEDSGWSNPSELLVRAERTLIVTQVPVTTPSAPSLRGARDLPVLGFQLLAHSPDTDTLTSLRLLHTSVGPSGPAAKAHLQVASTSLWLDADANGDIGPGDVAIASTAPDSAGTLAFPLPSGTPVLLESNTPIGFVVTMTPDSLLVRDAESLRVALQQAGDVATAGGLQVLLAAGFETLEPPVIDGQSARGYGLRPVAGGALFAGSKTAVVLDITLPSNGVDDDTLEKLRLENSGTATSADVAAVELWLDGNDDGLANGQDVRVGSLRPLAGRVWEASGLSVPLVAKGTRCLVTVEVATSPESGATWSTKVPRSGISVASGNDGPIDGELQSAGTFVFSVADRVTWVAGIADNHVVSPLASRNLAMVLEIFNGYASSRTLDSVALQMTGTAAETEFSTWELFADENQNGLLDVDEKLLASAKPSAGSVDFTDFAHVLPSLQQERLLVAYMLEPLAARDASVIDIRLASGDDLGYVETGTISAGAFPLDSPGRDTVDGFVAAQVTNNLVLSRTLGSGETDVLVFDLVLPSNGWEDDTLLSLRLEAADTTSAAVFGQDFGPVRLWRETDPPAAAAHFDPATDALLGNAALDGSQLAFEPLASAIPAGGQRFYVSFDTAADPTAGRRVQLRVPRLGIEMASANDGPLDVEIQSTALHEFSAEDLLANLWTSQTLASRGQELDLTVQVRNQGTMTLSSIVPTSLVVDPPLAASFTSGPLPLTLSLAPGAEGMFTYRFVTQAAGTLHFTVQVADSASRSDPRTSAPLVVVEPPSALAVAPLSTLPPTVNRGQVVPVCTFDLAHPDVAGTAADIRITSLRLLVEDTSGNALDPSTVFDRLTLSAGGVTHASIDSVPTTNGLQFDLDPAVVLQAGDELGLAVTAAIAAQATARDIRLRLGGVSEIVAIDANSAQPVAVDVVLPWTTQSATIHTLATRMTLDLERTLPLTVNRGQLGVPAGRLAFSLPGSIDESEARIVALTIDFGDVTATPIDPAALASRITVRNGGTTLLESTNLAASAGRLQLNLAIPQLVASGAPQVLDLFLDLRPDTNESAFTLSLVDSSAVFVRDATSGDAVVVAPNAPGFPWVQGPAAVQEAAGPLQLLATSRTPASTFPSARDLQVADISLSRLQDAVGNADVEISSLTFRTLDDAGNEIPAVDAISAARIVAGGSPLPTSGAPAASASVTLVFDSPRRLSPGNVLDLQLFVNLSAAVASPWLRFSFEPQSLTVRDANDTTQVVSTIGSLPFATDLMRIVAPPSGVAAGPIAEPPVNVGRGTTAEVLSLRLAHPGAPNESVIQPTVIVILMRDANGSPLPVDAVASAGRIRAGSNVYDAILSTDSLLVNLAGSPVLAPGQMQDLVLDLDIGASPRVSDFRLGLDAAGVGAEAGGTLLQARPLEGVDFPWLSPTVHLAANELSGSLSSYPNPFTPAMHDRCRITFFLAAESQVDAEIYTLTGERVIRLLENTVLAAGLHDDLDWDGRNGNGDPVRSGTYLLRLDVSGPGGGQLLRKLAVKR